MEQVITYDDNKGLERVREYYTGQSCRGIRIIIDGQQIVFGRWSRSLERQLLSCCGVALLCRNMIGELLIDYDQEQEERP